MSAKLVKGLGVAVGMAGIWSLVSAATVNVDVTEEHQVIRGFGGMVHNQWQGGGGLSEADAKLAFGTGTHETTQMIVSTLLSMAESNGGTLSDKCVLDCGCGTGILGIAASKLGAKEVVGYDIDEWSVRNTMHNAEINGVKNIKALLGDASVIKTIDGTFDIVLANINRNILLNDMEAMRSKMASGTTFIISGFYEEDIPLLVDKASALGLSLKEQKGKGQWRCLVFQG